MGGSFAQLSTVLYCVYMLDGKNIYDTRRPGTFFALKRFTIFSNGFIDFIVNPRRRRHIHNPTPDDDAYAP